MAKGAIAIDLDDVYELPPVDAAGAGREVAGQGEQQRRAPTAGRAGHGQPLPGFDVEVDVPEHPAAPGAGTEPARFHNGGHNSPLTCTDQSV